MEKTWKCSSCDVLYFTRAAVVKHIAEAHKGTDAAPERTKQIKPTSSSRSQMKPTRRSPQLKICRTSQEVQDLLWSYSSGYSIVLHPSMSTLTLNNISVKPAQLVSILNSSNLTTLNLASMNLRDTGIKALCEVLQGNSSLKNLALPSNNITGEGLRLIFKLLRRTALRSLDLSKNPWSLNTECVEALGSTSSLVSLNIAGIPAENEETLVSLGEMLASSQTLAELDMSGIDLTQKASVEIGTALKKNASLRSLAIYGDLDPDNGVVPLFEALVQNETLRTLIFWYNEKVERDEARACEGIKAVCEALKQNKSITGLSFLSPSKRKPKVKFGNASFLHFADLLTSNEAITSFQVNSDDTAEDTKHIAEALKTNKSLKNLELRCSTLDLGSFAEVLSRPSGSKLKGLVLSHARDFLSQYFIDKSDGWSVDTTCHVVEACKELKSFDVPVYMDKDEEAERLLTLLWHNSRLTHFNVNFDRLHPHNEKAIRNYLSDGVLEDFIVDSRTVLLQNLIAINQASHYGWLEFKYLKLGQLDAGSLIFSFPLPVLVLLAELCREFHFTRKKKHVMITWWVKEMLDKK